MSYAWSHTPIHPHISHPLHSNMHSGGALLAIINIQNYKIYADTYIFQNACVASSVAASIRWYWLWNIAPCYSLLAVRAALGARYEMQCCALL